MVDGHVIALDARMIEMSGIGTYIQHIVGRGIYDIAIGNEEEIRRYDSKVEIIPWKEGVYNPKMHFSFPSKAVKNAGVELVHFPHYNVPWNYSGRFVVTVHDLIHVLFPEYLGSGLEALYAKNLISHALRKAERVMTVSENSAADIMSLFHTDADKIKVTYLAADEFFQRRTADKTKYLYRKYGIPENRKVILYVGNLKPHKNLMLLTEAYSKLPNDLKDSSCVVLAGKAFKNWNVADNLSESEQIITTGAITKDELIDLYNLADLFVFPSLYEGFGLPPLEAMACGTPVICSNVASMPEVVGDAAMMINPINSTELSKGIETLLCSQEIRDDLISRGTARCREFSWDDTADAVRTLLATLF